MPDKSVKIPLFSELKPISIEHENPWFTVKNRGGYYTIELVTPQVMIIPVVEDFGAVLVEVVRPIISRTSWELPAGGANVGETPVCAAQREMREETGIEICDINRFHPEPDAVIFPNRFPDVLYVFSIQLSISEFKERKDHDDEVVTTALFTWREIIDMIREGKINVTTPIALLSRKMFDIFAL